MEPDQILAAATHVYATCKSYTDEGTAITSFVNSGEQNVVSFSTRFLRPQGLRFEYRANSMGVMQDHMVVCWTGANAQSWWSLRGALEEMPLAAALAAATGVSGGVAHLVPGLLMPQLGVGSVLKLEHARLSGESMDEGVECVVVEGSSPGRGPVVLWLDRLTFLVRKLVQPPTPVNLKPEARQELRDALGTPFKDAARALGLDEAQVEAQFKQVLEELDDPAADDAMVTTQTILYRPAIGMTLGNEHFQYVPPR